MLTDDMLKYLIFAALIGCARAEELDIQTQLYIVAGILGGVCLLLTIVSIYNAVTLINVQTKLKLTKSAGASAIDAVAHAAPEPHQYEEPIKSRSPPPSLGYPRQGNYGLPPPRDNYRMDRPATPARPPHPESRRNMYY